jgi:hypothetical protein
MGMILQQNITSNKKYKLKNTSSSADWTDYNDNLQT